MANTLNKILQELEDFQIKKAQAEPPKMGDSPADPKVMDPKATSGAGDSLGKLESDVDATSPDAAATDDGTKSTDYEVKKAKAEKSATAVLESIKKSMLVIQDQIKKAQEQVVPEVSKTPKPKVEVPKAEAKPAVKPEVKKAQEEKTEEEKKKEEEAKKEEETAGPSEGETEEEKKAYQLSKKAGAAAAEIFLQKIMAPQPMSKEAAVNEYLRGYQLAGELVKQAALEQHAKGIVAEAMLQKRAGAEFAERLLRKLASPNLTKEAAELKEVLPVLADLLASGTITEEEKAAIINYLASVESLNEESIAQATQSVSAGDAVAEALRKLLSKSEDYPAPASPEPTTPVSATAPEVPVEAPVEAPGIAPEELLQIAASLKKLAALFEKKGK